MKVQGVVGTLCRTLFSGLIGAIICLALLFHPIYAATKPLEAAASLSAHKRIVMVDEQFDPVCTYDRGEQRLAGLGIDLLEAAAQDAGMAVSYIRDSNLSWEEKIGMLERGEIDILFPIHLSDNLQVHYSQPLFTAAYTVITRDADAGYIDDLRDLQGRKIGVVCASGIEEYAKKHLASLSELHEYADYDSLYVALSSGQVDVILQKKMVFEQDYFVRELFGFQEADLDFSYLSAFGYAFADLPELDPLREALDARIEGIDFAQAVLPYQNGRDAIVSRYVQQKDDRWKIVPIVAGLYVMIILLFLCLYRYKRKIELLEVQSKIYESAFLKAQIKPHFLYNALGGIMSVAYVDGEEAGALLGSLTNYLRILYNTDSTGEFIPLSKELELVRSYVEIEAIRYGNRLKMVYDIEKKCQHYYIMPLIVQPLVENAIRHGIAKKAGGGTVTLCVCEADGVLTISVKDDGVGMSAQKIHDIMERQSPRDGVGLKNIQTRIRKYVKSGDLQIVSQAGHGTEVTITMKVLGLR